MSPRPTFVLGVLRWLYVGFCALAAPLAAADFFASPAGNDINPGTEAKPFATLPRARDAIRKAKSKSPARDYSVEIRGGLYRVPDTIVFSLADTAADGHTITYAAAPGETPVFTASIPLTGWTRKPGTAAWTTPLPPAARPFLTLSDRAGRLPRARGPAFSPTQDYRTADQLGRSTLPFPPRALADWPDLADAELVIRPNYGWILNILPIESVDTAAGLARTRIPASYPMVKVRWGLRDVNTKGTAWIENARPHLDAARAAGRELRSKFGDPLFLAPDAGDFRFAPDSPAPALGIEPLDLHQVGLRK